MSNWGLNTFLLVSDFCGQWGLTLNTLMKRILRTIRNLMRDQQESVNRIDGVLEISQSHHCDIADAIKENNPKLAEERLTEHLMAIKEKFESLR